MKKTILILFLFITVVMNAQIYTGYQRLGKLTTTEIADIDTSNTNVVYTAYDTTLGIEVINTGSGWVPRITTGSGGGVTDGPLTGEVTKFDGSTQTFLDATAISNQNTDTPDIGDNFLFWDGDSGGSLKKVEFTTLAGLIGGSGTPQDLEDVLTQDNDAGGLDIDNVGSMTVNGDILTDGSNSDIGVEGDPFVYLFTTTQIYDHIALGSYYWITDPSGGAGSDSFGWAYQTNPRGTRSFLYTLNKSGTPTDGTDLITLDFFQANTSSSDAEDVTYDNATSGLTATDVQDAIDEIAGSSISDSGQGWNITLDDGLEQSYSISDDNLTSKRVWSFHKNDTLNIDTIAVGKSRRFTARGGKVILNRPADGAFILASDSTMTTSGYIEVEDGKEFFVTTLWNDEGTTYFKVDYEQATVGSYEMQNPNPEEYDEVSNAASAINNIDGLNGLSALGNTTMASVANTSPADLDFMWEITGGTYSSSNRSREAPILENSSGFYDVSLWVRTDASDLSTVAIRFEAGTTDNSYKNDITNTWEYKTYRIEVTTNTPTISFFVNYTPGGSATDKVYVTGLSFKRSVDQSS